MADFSNLTKDLNKINKENSALRIGYIDPGSFIEDVAYSLVGFNSIHKNNQIYTLTNLSDVDSNKSENNQCRIKLPKGAWIEIINTDNKKYGGSGKFTNPGIIFSDGNSHNSINISKFSTIYLKKIN